MKNRNVIAGIQIKNRVMTKTMHAKNWIGPAATMTDICIYVMFVIFQFTTASAYCKHMNWGFILYMEMF